MAAHKQQSCHPAPRAVSLGPSSPRRQMPAFDPWLSDHFGQAHNLGGPMMMAHAMQPPWMGDLPLSPGMGVPGRVSDSTIAMSALAGLRFARGGSSEYTTDLNESGK